MISYPNVKVNIGLHVLRKRPDGYHDLETLFVPYLGFHDTLEIVPAAEFRFIGEGVTWDHDLTVRAYELLRADFGLPPVEIRLTKASPVGAGLGGGSADAAFALRMLSELFGLGLSDQRLAAYAARLGSDCPFFIYNQPMLGEGRGEVLTPFAIDLSAYALRVVVPEGISVSTTAAYRGVRPRCASSGPDAPAGPDAPSLRELLALPVDQWRGCLVNDFEASVFPQFPELARLKDELYAQGAVYASMSGSGSALFGLFPR